jgi:hypothetical protein
MNEPVPSKERPEWWDRVGPQDFDGHTEFSNMTIEQRLIWLAQVQRFYWEIRQAAGDSRRDN